MFKPGGSSYWSGDGITFSTVKDYSPHKLLLEYYRKLSSLNVQYKLLMQAKFAFDYLSDSSMVHSEISYIKECVEFLE